MSDADIEELLAPAKARAVPPMAFSLDDVVHRGHVVRRRRAAVLVVTVAVAAVVVGGFTVLRPPGGQVPAGPPLTPAQQQTTDRLDDLISQVPLPQDRSPMSPVTWLQPAQDPPAGRSVHRLQWFHVAMQPPELYQWIKGHGWLWAVWSTSATSDETSGSFLFTTSAQAQNVDFPDPIVSVTYTLDAHGGSAVRVDAWQQPLVTPDRTTATLLSDAVDSVSVTSGPSGTGGAYQSTLTLQVSGPRLTALRTALNRDPVAITAGVQCLSTDAVSLEFHDGSRTVDFDYVPDCPSMAVRVNGRPQPSVAAYDPGLLGAIAAASSAVPRY